MFSVLVADDDQLIRRLLQEALVREGYEVKTAESGVMAIKKVLKQNVDALILDIHIAGMTGIEVIPIIKKVNPYLPIITITGDTSLEIERKVRTEGIFYYFVKPFDLEKMKRVVKSALSYKVSRKKQSFNLNSVNFKDS